MAIGRADRPFGGARLILTVEWGEAVALAVPQRSASSGWQRKRKDVAPSLGPPTAPWQPVVAACACPRGKAMACAMTDHHMRSGSNGKGPLCSLRRSG